MGFFNPFDVVKDTFWISQSMLDNVFNVLSKNKKKCHIFLNLKISLLQDLKMAV